MDLERCRLVDIIIPIYNAYEELQLCVESIKMEAYFLHKTLEQNIKLHY